MADFGAGEQLTYPGIIKALVYAFFQRQTRASGQKNFDTHAVLSCGSIDTEPY